MVFAFVGDSTITSFFNDFFAPMNPDLSDSLNLTMNAQVMFYQVYFLTQELKEPVST